MAPGHTYHPVLADVAINDYDVRITRWRQETRTSSKDRISRLPLTVITLTPSMDFLQSPTKTYASRKPLSA